MSQFDIEVSPSEPVTSRFGIEASPDLGTSQFDIEVSQPVGPILWWPGAALWL
jgi:hypothetical protein